VAASSRKRHGRDPHNASAVSNRELHKAMRREVLHEPRYDRETTGAAWGLGAGTAKVKGALAGETADPPGPMARITAV